MTAFNKVSCYSTYKYFSDNHNSFLNERSSLGGVFPFILTGNFSNFILLQLQLSLSYSNHSTIEMFNILSTFSLILVNLFFFLKLKMNDRENLQILLKTDRLSTSSCPLYFELRHISNFIIYKYFGDKFFSKITEGWEAFFHSFLWGHFHLRLCYCSSICAVILSSF